MTLALLCHLRDVAKIAQLETARSDKATGIYCLKEEKFYIFVRNIFGTLINSSSKIAEKEQKRNKLRFSIDSVPRLVQYVQCFFLTSVDST